MRKLRIIVAAALLMVSMLAGCTGGKTGNGGNADGAGHANETSDNRGGGGGSTDGQGSGEQGGGEEPVTLKVFRPANIVDPAEDRCCWKSRSG